MAIQTPPDNSDYKIEVSIGPPEAEQIGERPQRPEQPAPQQAEAQPEQPAQPEPAIDLDQDPFGDAFTGESEMVAGRGKVLRRLLELFGRSADEAPPPPPDAPPADQLPVGPVVEGDVVREPAKLGATPGRPLTNRAYFQSENTRNLLDVVQRHGEYEPPQGRAMIEARAEAIEIEKLIGKKPSERWSREELFKLRQVLDAQAGRVKQLGDDLQRRMADPDLPDPTAEELVEFEIESSRFVGYQDTVSQVATETARMLQSLQWTIDTPTGQLRAIQDVLREAGGEAMIREKVRNVAAAQTSKQVASATRAGFGARTWDFLVRWRYNAMLSSPKSHVANIMGSTVVTAYENAVIQPLTWLNHQLVAAGHRAVGSNQMIEGMAFTSPMDSLSTMWMGAKEGAKTFRQIAAGRGEEELKRYGGKWVNEIGSRYKPHEVWGSQSGSALVRGAGRVADLPTRLLEAEDSFFRTLAYTSQLHRAAQRRAFAEFPNDKARAAQRVGQLVESPTQDMTEEAREFARKVTFTNDPNVYAKWLAALNKTGRAVQEYPLGQLIVPFVQTPINLLGYTLEQTTGGLIAGRTYQKLRSGNPQHQAEALSRLEASAALAWLSYYLWEERKITGVGSQDYRRVQLLEASGWQRNSVKLGDTYINVERLDPAASVFNLFATFYDLLANYDLTEGGAPTDVASASIGTLFSVADMLSDRTMLRGIVEVIEALGAAPERKAQKGMEVGADVVMSMVPSILRVPRDVTSGLQRDLAVDWTQPDAVIDRVKNLAANRLIGAEAGLPPRIDWKGDYREHSLNPWLRGWVPLTVTGYGSDDFDMASTVLFANDVVPTRPPQYFPVPGTGNNVKISLRAVDPSGVLYASYSQIVGRRRHELITDFVNSSEYRDLNEKGLTGADSPAARALKRLLGAGIEEANATMLEMLQTAGSTWQLGGDYTFTLPKEMAVNVNAVVEAQQAGQQLDHPALYYPKKLSTTLPPDLENRMNEQLRF